MKVFIITVEDIYGREVDKEYFEKELNDKLWDSNITVHEVNSAEVGIYVKKD